MNLSEYRHDDEMPASHRAAQAIVPLILELTGPVKSVVDVGGGDGGWLREFQRHGCKELLLLDAPEVRPHLVIEPTAFQPLDMQRDDAPAKKCELALCLECAEHLPAKREQWLVDYLTSSADVVVFSAAVPGQGGKGHINERVHFYWTELFSRRGFRCLDVLRGRIVHDTAIPWWYRQNMFVYASDRARLIGSDLPFLPADMCLIHRDVMARMLECGVRERVRLLGRDIRQAVLRKIAPQSRTRVS